MNRIARKRQSCEACRTRKLKCSGEKSGCSRCRTLSLSCRFQDKGIPGRPKKQPPKQLQQESSHGEPQRASCFQFAPDVPQGSTISREIDNILTGNGDFGSFPIELLGPGHSTGTQELPDLSLDTFVSPLLSCNCTEEVSESIRTLTRAPMSHSFIRSLRVGVDLVERLLTCPVCYDVTKSPRITIQNVLFIGRLMAEITSGYHRYLRWLKETCNALSDRNYRETVYLIPGLEISPVLGFKVSGEKLQDLITNGLQADAERLTALARRFALRQRDRHMIGHEACPDAGGRCWREKYGVGLDPLDICPQSPAAKSLTPCYRVVEEVAATIKQFADCVV